MGGGEGLTPDCRESWELFLMAATRETHTDTEKRESDQFHIDWPFVDAWLTHVDVDDAERLLRDLHALVRGLNQ